MKYKLIKIFSSKDTIFFKKKGLKITVKKLNSGLFKKHLSEWSAGLSKRDGDEL